MKAREYEVTIKCGVLMTTKTVRVFAASEEEAVEQVKKNAPYSSVTDVVEVQDAN